jgi:hypothetical protein
MVSIDRLFRLAEWIEVNLINFHFHQSLPPDPSINRQTFVFLTRTEIQDLKPNPLVTATRRRIRIDLLKEQNRYTAY